MKEAQKVYHKMKNKVYFKERNAIATKENNGWQTGVQVVDLVRGGIK